MFTVRYFHDRTIQGTNLTSDANIGAVEVVAGTKEEAKQLMWDIYKITKDEQKLEDYPDSREMIGELHAIPNPFI